MSEPAPSKSTRSQKSTKSAKQNVAALVDAAEALWAARSGRTGTVDRSERRDAGRSLRTDVPRADHGDWAPAPDRPDPVAVLVEQGRTRVADLLPIRYGRMVESPFGFLRGAPAVMAGDLRATPTTGIRVQLCGDAHLMNFGGFGTPERRLIFDVNDFDETLPGPWEWDLKRLAASFAVAARAKELGDDDAIEAVERAALAYAAAMTHLAGLPTLDAWYTAVDADAVERVISATTSDVKQRDLDAAVARAHSHSMLQAVARLTEVVDGRRRIVDDPPLVVHVAGDDELDRIAALFASYGDGLPDDHRHLLDRFEVADAARKVVGVGSVGTRCSIVLLDGGGEDDALLLQVKEAEASVLEAHLEPSEYANHGRRVVEGQRLMQAASDLFLGWSHDDRSGRDHYWRQLRDMKMSADVARLRRTAFLAYAPFCGATLARAHARSGDAAAISGYLGKGGEFAAALARFALAYADQNARDHEALRRAVQDGRVPAQSGV